MNAFLKFNRGILLNVRQIYEQFRSLIVLLGLVELGGVAYWFLGFGESTPGYLATVVVWIIGMLGWMALVIQFPMLLAPNFTVPLFILAHGFALVQLLTL